MHGFLPQNDELIRQQCRAREEYCKYQRTIDKALKDTAAERDRLAIEKEHLIAKKAKAFDIIQEQVNSLKEKDNALKEKEAEIQRLQTLLTKGNN